jgi:hypothetical protein
VLANNISVAQSLVGFVILIGLQFIVDFVVVRWSYLRPSAIRSRHCCCIAKNLSTTRRAGSALPKPMCAPRFAIKVMAALKMSAP